MKPESQILWTESQNLWKNSVHFNVVHRKVDWQIPKMKSLISMPVKYHAFKYGNLLFSAVLNLHFHGEQQLAGVAFEI